ncbi:MAG: bifunctional [glutamate--ammonia ligase]-adenylyl-L-tyrosine phosphorylase/[glutamate--ammonia-ligase] adenylyltransferase [Pseudomonadales bacterium]
MSELPALLHPLPEALDRLFHKYWQKFTEAAGADYAEPLKALAGQIELVDQLAKVWAGSDFVAESCCAAPGLLFDLVASGDLLRRYDQQTYIDKLSDRLASIVTEEELMRELRLFRQREQLRIIWRDLARSASLLDTTTEVSWLADVCIDQALEWLYQQACDKWGTPCTQVNDEWLPQRMVVIGMGKLGANELNVSSDIDLMFTYQGKGVTRGGKRELDNQEFFVRLGQRLIHVLDSRTADGFVFRVDMRLRPYGQSGALALNFDAMCQYYQLQGRDWERYAMIKARIVAGDKQAGIQLRDELRPFVYRKYLDYGAIEALRSMKELIRREEKQRGLQQNVKLGSGGIREIEFIAQVFQLIRGGKDKRLQQRGLRGVFETLVELDIMTTADAQGLLQAYEFLRNTEHALQAVRDEQTQRLPDDDLGRLRLAYSMGFPDWQAFSEALDRHRRFVHEEFVRLIAPPKEEEELDEKSIKLEQWQVLWRQLSRQELNEEWAAEFVSGNGFDDAADVLKSLQQLATSKKVASLQPIPQQRLDEVMPMLLAELATVKQPVQALERVLPLVESVLRRTAYLVLLVENPGAMTQLVTLCAASPWIAEELALHPILLDELLDVNDLYNPLDPDALRSELRQHLLRIPEDDVEEQMDCLRYFKRAQVLRVAASEVVGVSPIMKVSDHLTYIAEAVLNEVLQMAWKHMTDKYGVPQQADAVPCDPSFIIVGYGKLGGLELGYGSDLDLVFLDDAPNHLMTDGERPIENSVFFTRLAQRIIHLLTTLTAAGQLYEVDMRLRPSGSSGLLVTSLEGFEAYQNKQAWTWEHQALVRARVITGSARVQAQFEQLRREILSKSREESELRQQVLEMRGKITEMFATHKRDQEVLKRTFGLKYDAGGIVDIEFIVQYAVLRWSQNHPELLQYTDNIRILETLEQLQLFSAADADWLREAYKALRTVIHRLTLDQQPSRLSQSEAEQAGLLPYREAVMRIWQQVLKPYE